MRGSVDGADIRRVRDKSGFTSYRCRCNSGISRSICQFLGGHMKRVILEYAGAGIAVVGAISFFAFLSRFFMGKEGVFATFISMVLGGL